ncbi:MAG: hypothetical protein ABT10_10925 [Novosphingobium sp. SCN 63-17]|uniref:DUF805 domain-containing protein n=2 Tax=Novosphingobium TaxID=165696 RepID=UPI00086C82C0|nr:DUF805 domain-containing protein [Novosphingobium sp. 1748]MBN9145709.1 DUF805 domain-containing protein [Novosphingobium sp.]ODU82393.1 MAG: hypothetical protein ABT10_10925 [Novosphingobium sp. SCN 63-17]OJX97108.1 MAG: hypothetical protein BGP00_03865 [Novosphingobium sp. 63-713]
MHWMFLPLRRYFEISGRSQRREFWLYFIALWVVNGAIMALFGAPVSYTNGMNFYWGTQTSLTGQFLVGLIALFTLIPSYTVSIRRLHDIDRSGWWLLVWLVPFVGWFVLLIFFCLDGTYGRNRYGDDPRGRGMADVFR